MLGALGITGKLDCVSGDMTDEAAVITALRGCKAVLHCAAVVTTDRRREAEMLHANPRGAELVVGHAARLGLDPIVYVSSVAALIDPGLDRLTTELPLGTLQSAYARSKAAAEDFVRKWQDQGVPIVITYPGSVTGPAAGTVLGEATQGIASNIKLGSLPSHDAAWSLIDARDLGAIHAALMVKGLGPRRFMCGGHYVRMEDLATQLPSDLPRCARATAKSATPRPHDRPIWSAAALAQSAAELPLLCRQTRRAEAGCDPGQTTACQAAHHLPNTPR